VGGTGLQDTDQPTARRGETPRVWTMEADAEEVTLLVAAGPPAAAQRPRAAGRVRGLRDWLGSLAGATLRTLDGVMEAALLELRGFLEGGRAVADDDARAFGEAAGRRLWDLARAARDLGAESHFEPLTRLRAVIAAIRAAARGAAVQRVFDLVEDAFASAARGATTIDFRRSVRRGVRLVRVLVTGFDPFEPTGSLRRPDPGTWNPSAAAALAVDGQTVDAGRGARAAIESVVLPVSFGEFAAGLVERIVGPRRNDVDAVVTVSMDPGIDPSQGVRLERFAVGAHDLGARGIEPVPPAPGEPIGTAIIESTADVEALAADPAVRGPRPTVGTDVTLRFADLAAARAALTALGLGGVGGTTSRDAVISDPAAIRTIIGTAAPPDRARAHRIRFRAGGREHTADVVSGPGGNFLSNEVSYRVLRSLAQASGQPLPASFHVHTQRGEPIPQAPGLERRRVLESARGVRSRLIETIRSLVGALARRIAGRP
jgi:pyrrolidone-carboxylate peptidase